jgi:hypothetical protein
MGVANGAVQFFESLGGVDGLLSGVGDGSGRKFRIGLIDSFFPRHPDRRFHQASAR